MRTINKINGDNANKPFLLLIIILMRLITHDYLMRLIAHNDSMRREKQGNRTLSESRFPTSHSMFYNVTPFLKMENYNVTPFLKMEISR